MELNGRYHLHSNSLTANVFVNGGGTQRESQTDEFRSILLQCGSGIALNQLFIPYTTERGDFVVFVWPFISLIISLFEFLCAVHGIRLSLSLVVCGHHSIIWIQLDLVFVDRCGSLLYDTEYWIDQ